MNPLLAHSLATHGIVSRRTTDASSSAARWPERRCGRVLIPIWVRESKDEPWSALEREAHRLLREAGILGWVTNHRVRVEWGLVYLDIAFPGVKLAIEIDGWEFHGDHASFVGDRRRDVALQLAGWTVLRFSASTLAELPGAVRRWLGRAGRVSGR